MFEAIMNWPRFIQTDVSDIKSRLQRTQEALQVFSKRLDQLGTDVVKLQNSASDTESLKLAVDSIQDDMNARQAKLANIEDRSRRANFIVFGTGFT